jgi:hypothetical protein
MAQAVSRRSLTAEARVRSRVSRCGICGTQRVTGQAFTRVLRFSLVNFIAPLLGKISITGLHNKPQGCGASVASAAGTFTKKKY